LKFIFVKIYICGSAAQQSYLIEYPSFSLCFMIQVTGAPSLLSFCDICQIWSLSMHFFQALVSTVLQSTFAESERSLKLKAGTKLNPLNLTRRICF